MILGFITLLTAIAISSVAAYYSILGLVAIFSAAALPIIVMGGVLEAGKLMAAVWLHKNWKRASFAYKLYLVPAIVVLMLLTSMGVFGFLSKAHLDQGIPTADIEANIQLIDVRINAQMENIDVSQKILDQLDREVEEILARSKSEAAVRRASQLRTKQATEREKLQASIDEARAEIAKLNEEKAIITTQLRKLVAEVGPVKYVAELIYGEDSGESTLDKAVRWVIITIVGVFDPLAIVLLLASTKQFEWAIIARDRRREEKERTKTITTSQTNQKELDALKAKADVEKEKRIALEKTVTELNEKLSSITEQKDATQTELQLLKKEHASLVMELEHLSKTSETSNAETTELQEQIQQLKSQIDQKESEKNSLTIELSTKTQLLKELQSDLDEMLKTNESTLVHAREIDQTNAKLQEELNKYISELDSAKAELEYLTAVKETLEDALARAKDNEQSESQNSDDTNVSSNIEEAKPVIQTVESISETQTPLGATEINVTMDVEFTPNPNKGDICIRVDFTPSKIFKWNGDKWIAVSKEHTDSYLACEEYIEFMKAALDNGTYSLSDLTPQEQQAISKKR